jgi:hypothetical protein
VIHWVDHSNRRFTAGLISLRRASERHAPAPDVFSGSETAIRDRKPTATRHDRLKKDCKLQIDHCKLQIETGSQR